MTGSLNGKYVEEISAELNRFDKRINVHDLPNIYHYWANKYISPDFKELGIDYIDQLFLDPILKLCEGGRIVKVASLGAGNCELECRLARNILDKNKDNIKFYCFELSKEMLNRGRARAREQGIEKYMEFIACDANYLELDQKYDVFIASHSLHHFVRLEYIFEAVRSHMSDGGYFIVNDMIGRNGHMRWPEAYDVVCKLWQLLPKKYKWNHLLNRHEEVYENWDCSTDGFEGARAQDILPLLIRYFKFELFYAFGNVIDIFVDRTFGHNFEAGDPFDASFIDFAANVDRQLIFSGRIKPTHIIARLKLKLDDGQGTRIIGDLTPEKCVRRP